MEIVDFVKKMEGFCYGEIMLYDQRIKSNNNTIIVMKFNFQNKIFFIPLIKI